MQYPSEATVALFSTPAGAPSADGNIPLMMATSLGTDGTASLGSGAAIVGGEPYPTWHGRVELARKVHGTSRRVCNNMVGACGAACLRSVQADSPNHGEISVVVCGAARSALCFQPSHAAYRQPLKRNRLKERNSKRAQAQVQVQGDATYCSRYAWHQAGCEPQHLVCVCDGVCGEGVLFCFVLFAVKGKKLFPVISLFYTH
jgi:hypothetical protein